MFTGPGEPSPPGQADTSSPILALEAAEPRGPRIWKDGQGGRAERHSPDNASHSPATSSSLREKHGGKQQCTDTSNFSEDTPGGKGVGGTSSPMVCASSAPCLEEAAPQPCVAAGVTAGVCSVLPIKWSGPRKAVVLTRER